MTAESMSNVVAAAADISLIIDKKGIVNDVAFGSGELSNAGLKPLIGRPWVDTVTTETRHKISELLEQAVQDRQAPWRQVNHPVMSDGNDVPVRYSALSLNRDGRVVAFGRDLRAVASLQQQLVDAQVSIERDYAKVRQAELRYRLLFQIASEGIIIADAATGRITEINPAAAALFREPAAKVGSHTLFDIFGASSASALRDMIAALKTAGGSEAMAVSIPSREHEITLSASLLRQGSQTFILSRLLSKGDADAKPVSGTPEVLRRVVDRLPDGFVVTALDGRILTANSAFLDLAQLTSQEQVRLQPLENWLGRSGVDVAVLIAALKEHGFVRTFSTVLRGAFGTTEDVDVSGVAVMGGEQPCLGFVVRGGLRPQPMPRMQALPPSVENLKELVGRVALKEVIRETSDMIEKLYIEAALELTGDNRASAAEMLGLSRQSLYVKLRRYGIGDLEPDILN